ncbi:unnamed protein product [Rotaria sordida]|uniref:Thioredoxin domain-containing protein n=1 Tax=Rotaria sordida TaxID=392033 RepID=A0A815JG19_9BILA|nr:unnamed protein product [Rotaria sordida]
MHQYHLKSICFFVLYYICYVSTGAIEITTDNLDSILSSHEIVLINFYANWCQFSKMVNPIYDKLADKVSKEYSREGLIAIGKVDSDLESSISTKYYVNKYPTFKLFRHSILTKREYRGARQIDGLLDFIHKQIQSPIIKLSTPTDLLELDRKKSYIIGHFNDENSSNYKIYSKVANLLRDECHFAASTNIEKFKNENQRDDIVYYRSYKSSNLKDEYYNGLLNNSQSFYTWTNDKCIDLVREITFENAEELTDQGLPLLILFHHIDDHQSISLFQDQIAKQLMHYTSRINCLHADGEKFLHPLRHLGKTIDNLPLLVIDTFQHMFIFPDFKQISINGKLLEFVKDLDSGKVHKDFHNPQSSTKQTIIQENVYSKSKDDQMDFEKSSSIENDDSSQRSRYEYNKLNSRSSPPESVFIHLTPSRQRYSFRDEL